MPGEPHAGLRHVVERRARLPRITVGVQATGAQGVGQDEQDVQVLALAQGVDLIDRPDRAGILVRHFDPENATQIECPGAGDQDRR